VKCSWVKCSEGLSDIVFNIIRLYTDHMKFAAFIIIYMVVCFVCFYLILLSCVFLLLCLCILIVMYVLFCIFCFHRANWHTSATLTEVYPCFFLSCKANARISFTKTGHGPHSSHWAIIFTRLVHRQF
jgi:hypothetical protein